MIKAPTFYLDGSPYQPPPGVEHLLVATHNGDPTCICGYVGASGLSQVATASRISQHVREQATTPSSTPTAAREVSSADPWAPFANTWESPTVARLRATREKAWPELRIAIDMAIMQALQAEHEASRASTMAMTGFDPSYPPLVTALSLSAPAPEPASISTDPWPETPVAKAPRDR